MKRISIWTKLTGMTDLESRTTRKQKAEMMTTTMQGPVAWIAHVELPEEYPLLQYVASEPL